MPRTIAGDLNELPPEIPGAGSYRPVYREGESNPCPGCGRAHWLVGRFSAECAFCRTALPLKEGSTRNAYAHREEPVFFTRSA